MIRADGGRPTSESDDIERESESGDGDGDQEETEAETDGRLTTGGGDLLETAIVVASVLLIIGTLGYVGWQATVTAEDGVPSATVEAIEPMPSPDDDRRQVTVRLDNQRGTGLSAVQVGVRCGGAERSLAFEHVPAGGHRTGTVVCPAGTAPVAEVVTWTEA